MTASKGEPVSPAACQVPSVTVIAGDPLEDRIRFGMELSIDARTAIGLSVARALEQIHAKKRYLEDFDARTVVLGLGGGIELTGKETSSKGAKAENIRGFGLILYQLLRGELIVVRSTPPDIEELYRAGLPQKLVGVVEGCLRDGERSSMKHVVQELEELMQLAKEGPKEGNPRFLAIALLAGLAVLSAVAWMILR